MQLPFTHLTIFLLLSFCSAAQSLTPEVNASAGDYFKTTGASLSWTIGECVTETFSSSNNKLTQGFQQGNFIVSLVSEKNETDFKIKFYPNPTKDFMVVSLSGKNSGYKISLFDALGRNVLIKNIKEEKFIIDFTGFSTGIYFMKIFNSDNTILKTFKVLKIN